MIITAKAREALEKARVLERQKKWKDAWYYYTIASREKSSEGTRGVERMLRKLEDHDIIDSSGIIRDRQKANAPTEMPKMTRPLSIPSEEPRTLIEDCAWSQQEPRKQQEKQNKTVEKPKIEKEQGNNTDELLKKAQELETKGKKKESFLLLKKAADCGSERAKAELGQKYLKLAIKYLGRDVAFEKLGAKVTSSRKDDKTETSTALKPHFRHQRNRIAELNGCGDTPKTETSVLHAEKAEETTWVGAAQKNNPPPPEVIIQEVVRHVTYWSGNDCLPELIRVDRQEPEACECPMQSGHEFSAEGIVWLEIPPAVATEEASRLMKAKEEEQQPKHGCMGILFLIFKKLFSIFRK